MPKGLKRVKPASTAKMAINGIQTGYVQTDITMITMAALEAIADILGKEAVVQDWTDYADLISAAPSDFINRDEDGISFHDHKLMVLQQLLVLFDHIATYNAWPVIPAVTDETAVLFEIYEWFRAGALLNDAPSETQDLTAATSLDERVDGIKNSDSGLGAHDYHVHKEKAALFEMGVAMASKIPPLQTDARGTSDATALERHIWYLFFPKLVAYCTQDLFGALNSEMAVNSIAAMLKGFLRSDMPDDIKKLKTNEHWAKTFELGRDDPIGANFADHVAFTQNFIGRTALLGSSLDTQVRMMNEEYVMMSEAITWGQNHFGLGLYNKEGETVFFGVLLNLVMDSQTYAAHGVTEYELGLNLAYVIDVFDILDPLLKKTWEKALSRQHWTWTDVIASVKDCLIPFNVSKSFHGVCSQDVYRGIRVACRCSDLPDAGTGWMNTGVVNDVTDMVDAVNDTWNYDETTSPWLFHFWNLAYLGKETGLMMDKTFTDQELMFMFDFDRMLYTSAALDEYRWTIARLHLVEAIQIRPSSEAKVWECNMYATSAQYRFENIPNVLAGGVSEATRTKYIMELFIHEPDQNWMFSVARPKGQVNSTEEYFEGIEHIETLRELAFIGTINSSEPKIAPPKTPPPNTADKNPPVKDTQVDKDDKTEESG